MFRQQFEGPLVLTPSPNGRKWKLHQAFSYETDAGLVIDIPAGFVTDLASVPRILWPILPPFGTYSRAAVTHDFLYAEHRAGRAKYSRAYADAVLLEALADCGCNRVLRVFIWLGVRLGGWAAWSKGAKPCVAH